MVRFVAVVALALSVVALAVLPHQRRAPWTGKGRLGLGPPGQPSAGGAGPNAAGAWVALTYPPSPLFGQLENGTLAPELRLTLEQAAAIARIDRLTRKWLARLAEGTDPASAAQNRLAAKKRKVIIQAAENFVTRSVFTSEQADAYERAVWKRMGTEALLEPEVANALGLSRRQRQEIASRIARRKAVGATLNTKFGGFLKSTSPGEGQAALKVMNTSADDLERQVWGVLDRAQWKRWQHVTRARPISLSPHQK